MVVCKFFANIIIGDFSFEIVHFWEKNDSILLFEVKELGNFAKRKMNATNIGVKVIFSNFFIWII